MRDLVRRSAVILAAGIALAACGNGEDVTAEAPAVAAASASLPPASTPATADAKVASANVSAAPTSPKTKKPRDPEAIEGFSEEPVMPNLTYPQLSKTEIRHLLDKLRSLHTTMAISQGIVRHVFDACYMLADDPEQSDRALVQINFPHDGRYTDEMVSSIAGLLKSDLCMKLPRAKPGSPNQ